MSDDVFTILDVLPTGTVTETDMQFTVNGVVMSARLYFCDWKSATYDQFVHELVRELDATLVDYPDNPLRHMFDTAADR